MPQKEQDVNKNSIKTWMCFVRAELWIFMGLDNLKWWYTYISSSFSDRGTILFRIREEEVGMSVLEEKYFWYIQCKDMEI